MILTLSSKMLLPKDAKIRPTKKGQRQISPPVKGEFFYQFLTHSLAMATDKLIATGKHAVNKGSGFGGAEPHHTNTTHEKAKGEKAKSSPKIKATHEKTFILRQDKEASSLHEQLSVVKEDIKVTITSDDTHYLSGTPHHHLTNEGQQVYLASSPKQVSSSEYEKNKSKLRSTNTQTSPKETLFQQGPLNNDGRWSSATPVKEEPVLASATPVKEEKTVQITSTTKTQNNKSSASSHKKEQAAHEKAKTAAKHLANQDNGFAGAEPHSADTAHEKAKSNPKIKSAHEKTPILPQDKEVSSTDTHHPTDRPKFTPQPEPAEAKKIVATPAPKKPKSEKKEVKKHLSAAKADPPPEEQQQADLASSPKQVSSSEHEKKTKGELHSFTRSPKEPSSKQAPHLEHFAQTSIGAEETTTSTPHLPPAETLIQQISPQLSAHIKNNGQGMTIDLRPEYLGKLRISLDLQNHILRAHIVAESPQAQKILEDNLSSLKMSLAKHLLDQGTEVKQFSVSVGGRGSDQNRGNNRHSKKREQALSEVSIPFESQPDQQSGDDKVNYLA